MKPHPNNACAGAFSDWLEVNLLSECNARCEWCVEKNGYHPDVMIGWGFLVNKILSTGKKNIMLLGGEPTLRPSLKYIIAELNANQRNVSLTTNGSLLSENFVDENLSRLDNINISIHHYNLEQNRKITGIDINFDVLRNAIQTLQGHGIDVRLNCNCIKNNIDDIYEIRKYIIFAKNLNADSVRFAELKNDSGSFINLALLLKNLKLSNDPFKCGCSINRIINNMPVNFRLMCGLQTPHRPKPDNPEQVVNDVLYYDGTLQKGWQTNKPKDVDMTLTDEMLIKILEQVKEGKMSVALAALKIKGSDKEKSSAADESGSGCRY